MYAAEAHLTRHGEKKLVRFDHAVAKWNANNSMLLGVTRKVIRHRVKRLILEIVKKDKENQMQSGTAVKMGGLDHLLPNRIEAIRNINIKRNQETARRTEQETRILAVGKDLILV